MLTSDRVRKLFSSPIFLFLFSSFFFGTGIQLMSLDKHPFSWIRAALFGIPFGLIMTIVTVRQMQQLKESTGLTNPAQLKALHAAVKKDELPADPEIRKALPAYLRQRYPTRSKLRNSMIFLVIVGAINLLSGLASQNVVQIGLSIAFLIFFLVVFRLTTRTVAKADRLYEQLGVEPETPIVPPAPPIDTINTVGNTWPDKSKWTIGAILIAVAILFALLLGSNTPPDNSIPQTSPPAEQTSNDSGSVSPGQPAAGSEDTIVNTGPLPDQGTITIEQTDTADDPSDTEHLQSDPATDPVNQYTVE